MKALVIYDSLYGNTERIARAIGAALGTQEQVEIVRVDDVRPEKLAGLNLLVVGSPTQRFNATPAVNDLLNGLTGGSLSGIRVAAFDTRFTQPVIDSMRPLGLFVKLWGRSAYACKHIADRLKNKGGELAAPPEGFFVEGTEGPLSDGELERAAAWARQIAAAL